MKIIHAEPHPNAGKIFRISIDGGNVQAGYDLQIHGALIRLVDWADRMQLNNTFSRRHRERALMFYAHRCLPNLPVLDPIPPEEVNFDGLVYGVRTYEYDGAVKESIEVLREFELIGPIEK